MPYRYIWTIRLSNPEAEEDFFAHWRAVSSILQSYPGAQGSHLHRIEGKPGCFLMIGEWESKQTRDTMSTDLHGGKSDRSKQWLALPPDDSFGAVERMRSQEIENIIPE